MNKQRRNKLSAIVGTLESIDYATMELPGVKKIISDCSARLSAIHDEEQAAYENLLPSLQDGEKGEQMQSSITAMDEANDSFQVILDIKEDNFIEVEDWRVTVEDNIDEALGKLEEAQA